ncbi:MAG: DUF4286 family protein [Muribaculaceae bacterium]|jgi:hypothetical protein|nr:DUF4286 family protein [Muribaculaceae bacterium]MBR1963446.1 DUF4286 family protein [Muribaculaceae bacterium]
MILLNTTFIVHKSIESQFITWAKETYVPTATDSNIFINPIFTRIMADSDPDGNGYAIQLRAQNLEQAITWHDTVAAKLKQELSKKWGEKILHFTTYMQIIH